MARRKRKGNRGVSRVKEAVHLHAVDGAGLPSDRGLAP